MKKVGVIGLGYIGLPTAILLAEQGIDVLGVDTNAEKISQINQAKPPFHEPLLAELLEKAIQSKKLTAVSDPKPCDVFLIAVPTPCLENHAPDLTSIQKAASGIAPYLQPGNLIILESTSPVGTTEQLEKWLYELRPDLKFPLQAGEAADIQLAYCPERAIPGKTFTELKTNDRIIGGSTLKAAHMAQDLYRLFVTGNCHLTTARTAEMAKLTENAFRDVNIAFANELSILCDCLKVNVWELIQLANLHPRVQILNPGPGVGGHCIAVDPWFLVHSAPNHAHLIRTARAVNDHKPAFILEKIKEITSSQKEPQVAFLGLSFKADIDDLRESPALEIVETFAKENAHPIFVVEPHLSQLPARLQNFKHVHLTDLKTAQQKSSLLVGLVGHREFKSMPRPSSIQQPFIDACGIWANS